VIKRKIQRSRTDEKIKGKVCRKKIKKEKKRSYREEKQEDSNIDDGKIAENNYEEFIDEGLKWAEGTTKDRRIERLKRYQEELFDEASRLKRQCDEKIDEKIQQEERSLSKKDRDREKKKRLCEKDKWRS